MTHENAGHYALKHPPETTLEPRVAEALKAKAKDGKISCAAAHKIAQNLKLYPAQIGVNIDLLEFRISKCQMGLFGYSPEKRIVKPAQMVLPELETAIRGAVEKNRIPCASCWAIAQQFDLSRLEIAGVCETLKIKVSPCQLGAF